MAFVAVSGAAINIVTSVAETWQLSPSKNSLKPWERDIIEKIIFALDRSRALFLLQGKKCTVVI